MNIFKLFRVELTQRLQFFQFSKKIFSRTAITTHDYHPIIQTNYRKNNDYFTEETLLLYWWKFTSVLRTNEQPKKFKLKGKI